MVTPDSLKPLSSSSAFRYFRRNVQNSLRAQTVCRPWSRSSQLQQVPMSSLLLPLLHPRLLLLLLLLLLPPPPPPPLLFLLLLLSLLLLPPPPLLCPFIFFFFFLLCVISTSRDALNAPLGREATKRQTPACIALR